MAKEIIGSPVVTEPEDDLYMIAVNYTTRLPNVVPSGYIFGATSAAQQAADAAIVAANEATAAAAAATAAAALFPPVVATQYLRGNAAGTAWETRTAAQTRSDLGLVIGTNVQAFDADLQAIAALTSAADKLPYATGTGTWALADFTAAGRALVDDADATAQRATLGLVIGTNVQAYDIDLAAIAALVSAADRLPYATGAGTWSLATFTAAGRALVDDADATAQRATLGLGTIATQAASSVAITGGTITGITDLALADGGTGASDAPTARTNLGLGTISTQAASAVAITGGSVTGITDLAVADGGTGASTASAALTNLGAMPLAGGNFTGLVSQSAGNGVVVGGSALVAGVYAAGAVTPQLQVQAAGAVGLAVFRAGASASPPILGAYKTRGASASAHTAVSTSDQLFAFAAGGSDGTAYRDGFRMIATVTGVPTSTNVPTRWDILTGDGTSSFVGAGGDQNGNFQVNQTTVITQARHIQLRSYTVATLPSAATAAQIIYVSDGTSNKRFAVSDGTNWRWPDGAVVS